MKASNDARSSASIRAILRSASPPAQAAGRTIERPIAQTGRFVASGRLLARRSGRLERVSIMRQDVVPARPSIGQTIGLHSIDDPLDLRSAVALVIDQRSNEPLFEKNTTAVLPIASITKLMTAMVVLDGEQSPTEMLEVTDADIDTERFSSSRLRVGSRLARSEMMQAALMASENRAANSLGRYYPGGLPAFVAAMNRKAASLGMTDSNFVDPTGLSSRNVSNAHDLARMVKAASEYPLIRQYSTATGLTVDNGYRNVNFHNTNRLVDSPDWSIALQKTGYINEAGNCLVMQSRIDGRSVIIVLLDGTGRGSRISDAQRLKRWLEGGTVRTSIHPGRVTQSQLSLGS